MPNALYQAMGGNTLPPQMQQLVQQYRQFRTMCQHGDPQQQVMSMLRRGQISQQQLNQYQQIAQQLQAAMKS